MQKLVEILCTFSPQNLFPKSVESCQPSQFGSCGAPKTLPSRFLLSCEQLKSSLLLWKSKPLKYFRISSQRNHVRRRQTRQLFLGPGDKDCFGLTGNESWKAQRNNSINTPGIPWKMFLALEFPILLGNCYRCLRSCLISCESYLFGYHTWYWPI